MSVRRSSGWLVVLCAGYAIAAAVHPSPASAVEGPSPWSVCLSEQQSNQVVEEYAKLISPASGATVVAGTSVTFSAASGAASPLTFMVASSPALLSSPDIDSGLGSFVWPEYSFISTKAAAIPRTIYWTASFTRVLNDCEGPPVTFTIAPRALTVLPSPTEEAAAAKKNQEEVAAKKKAEEEMAAAGKVSLDGATIILQSNHEAAVKLTCADTATCSGTLTLIARSTTGKGKQKHTKTDSIGTNTFLVTAGATATVNIELNETGRALLRAAHGHLHSTLKISRTSPLPSQTQAQRVQLEQPKVTEAEKARE